MRNKIRSVGLLCLILFAFLPEPLQAANPTKAQVVAAIGHLRFGTPDKSATGTATIIGPRLPDGRWHVITAKHCTEMGGKGTLTLKDGRVLILSIAAISELSDIAWLVTDDATITDLPYALLAEKDPEDGVKIWQAGYGVDRPCVTKLGKVTTTTRSEGKIVVILSVSHGDSGGGIFRKDTNELVGVVCCTENLESSEAITFGGPVSAARSSKP